MNEKMLQSVEFWESFGGLFPASVVIIRRTGELVYENTVFRNLVGSNLNNLFHFMDKDSLEKLKEAVSLSENETRINLNLLKIRKSKENIFYFISYLFKLKNDFFSLVLSDNTDENNKLMMLNNIVNAAPDPIFVKDEQHRYLYVNHAFAESLGHHVSYVIGKSDADFFPENESDIL